MYLQGVYEVRCSSLRQVNCKAQCNLQVCHPQRKWRFVFNDKGKEEKKAEAIEVEHPKYATETPTPVSAAKTVEKKAVVSKPVLSTTSSDSCAAIDKKLIKLYEFMIMVNNTSAFHLEEKASALSVPGITVSNNKKKMLRDAKKKRAKLLAERQEYGCETAGK